MKRVTFERIGGESPSPLPGHTEVECKICGWIYDPSAGDPDAAIPPGIAFGELPEHWRCPRCDSPPSHFLVLL